KVAVQAAKGLEGYGEGTGRITIVLDCSGSMGEEGNKQPDGRTRFRAALDALGQVLEKIPAGTKVSMWIFAHSRGADEDVYKREPERTIERILPPQEWRDGEARQKQIRDLMGQLGRLTPRYASPILRAMLDAKEDLEGGG